MPTLLPGIYQGTLVPHRDPAAAYTGTGVFTFPDPAVPDPVLRAATVRNLTCNVQGPDPAAQTADTIRDAADRADLIGWQELDADAVATLHTLDGWAHFLPGGAANAVAISWRADVWTLEDSEVIKVHGGVAHVSPTRYIVVVVLRHKVTRQLLVRVNTHVVHHIEAGGLPRKYTGTDLVRFAGQLDRARKHFTLLAAVVVKYREVAPVLWGGDLNVNLLAESRRKPADRCQWFPYTVMGLVSRFAVPAVPSHGSRLIDWTGYTDGLVLVSVTTQPSGYSDHCAVASVFQLQAAA